MMWDPNVKLENSLVELDFERKSKQWTKITEAVTSSTQDKASINKM